MQSADTAMLEDNPYGELRFSGEDVPTIKSMDTEGRVLYAGSFSKVMAPAFRLRLPRVQQIAHHAAHHRQADH